ncbi:hypothetical protein HQ545_05060 [Candidatus Woesearchaeota archaeon]|nr:hypothetical protein [Candidatus Woesearchaeota archaeon]
MQAYELTPQSTPNGATKEDSGLIRLLTPEQVTQLPVEVSFEKSRLRSEDLKAGVEELRYLVDNHGAYARTEIIQQYCEDILLEDLEGLEDFSREFVELQRDNKYSKLENSCCGLKGFAYEWERDPNNSIYSVRARIKGLPRLLKKYEEKSRKVDLSTAKKILQRENTMYELSADRTNLVYHLCDLSAVRIEMVGKKATEMTPSDKLKEYMQLQSLVEQIGNHSRMKILCMENKNKSDTGYNATHLEVLYIPKNGPEKAVETQILTRETADRAKRDRYHLRSGRVVEW